MAEAPRVLIIDANLEQAGELERLLAGERIETRCVATVNDALSAIDEHACDLVLSELSQSGYTSHDLIRVLAQHYPELPVVLVTSEASADDGLDALRAGAADLLFRPFRREQALFVIRKALTALERRPDPPAPLWPGEQAIFGQSKAIEHALKTLRRAAASDATVLVRGESGTGKELFARAIHDLSGRAKQPFVKIDCASLPENLLESELFGYEKGAFTGAVTRKPGRVELADGGTLFLDEIGELTAALQSKLLRLLQDREFERLGGTRVVKVSVRVVAATHRDLEAMTERGEFRQDLFYRLNVIPLWLPPLRARRADIDELARHFCARFARSNGKPALALDESALRVLRDQRWPGNIRQLQNFIERLVVLSDSPVLSEGDVRSELSRHARFITQAGTGTASALQPAAAAHDASEPSSEVGPLEIEVRSAERKALLKALKYSGGNRSRAARMLGVSRSTLYAKLQEHGLV